MANWNGLQLTNKGIALQAKVQAGTQLHITKLKLGSGVVPSGTDVKTLTDLIAPEQNLGIGGKEAVDDYCKISSTISNTGLEAGYYVRELGVFAQDPDDGEILYMYTTDGAPDYLPAGGGSTVISQEFSVMIAVDDTDNIVVDIDPAALATMGYVQLQIQEHNTDTTAHADFTGATAEAAGKRGMVPAPQAGDQDKFLTGGKTYVPVASQTEAEGMTDDKKPMTALKVKQLIDKLLGASNGIAGLDAAAKLQSILYDFATELEAQAGTNTTKPINAAGVAAAISALAGGAVIVDELLAQNGYVKFSNGLILQWGLFQTAGKRYNAVLSLSYQDWYFPVIAAKQAATEMIGYANLQLNDFDITLGSGDDSERSGAYLCFGKQQWGFQPKGSVGLQVIDLLLSTTTNLIAVSGQVGRTASDTNGSQNILYVTSTADTVSFRVVNTENYAEEAMPFFWLLIAVVQQWGYESNVSTRTVEYPTAYLITPPTVVTSSNGADAKSAVGNITLNSFSAINRAAAQSVWWFSIGVQQWGYVVGGINTFTVTFLITYIAAFGATASGAAEVATAANTEVSELTNTGFTLKRSSSSNPVYWVAWGIQQWGSVEQISLDSIFFSIPVDYLLVVLAHSFGQAPNGTWTYHSIIDNMELTGFQLTAGQAGSEHAAYQGIGGYWLSIGIILSQQWGSGEGSHSVTQGYNTWEFIYPIPYSASVLTLSITGTGHTTELGTDYCDTVTLSSVLVASHDKGYVIIIGIQQWRMLEIQATSQNVDFPIAFTEWCVACGSRVTGTGGNPTTLGANAAFSELATLTHARVFSVETQDYYLLAAGVQQWGYFYESQSDTDYRHFPVAFTTFLLPVLGKAYYLTTEPDGYVPYIEYLGSNNFLCGFGNNRIGNAYVPIMVIGMQQWGYIQTPNSSTTVDLKIPYTAAHYACFAQKADGKSGNAVEAWAGITAISLTNFTIRTHYDNTNYFLSCEQ